MAEPRTNENNTIKVGQDKLVEKKIQYVRKDLFKEMREKQGQQNFR